MTEVQAWILIILAAAAFLVVVFDIDFRTAVKREVLSSDDLAAGEHGPDGEEPRSFEAELTGFDFVFQADSLEQARQIAHETILNMSADGQLPMRVREVRHD